MAYIHLGTYLTLLLLGVGAILFIPLAAHPHLKTHAAVWDRARHLHAAIMVYLCVIPGIPLALGGLLLPKVLELRHDRLSPYSLGSLVLYWIAAITIIVAVALGGVRSGISYFSLTGRVNGPSLGVAVGVLLVGIACALNGSAAISTLGQRFATGIRSEPVPPIAGILCINGFMHWVLVPVQVLVVVLMALDYAGVHSLFEPASGHDPLLLAQLSWFYLHPLMIIAVLPILGVVDRCLVRISSQAADSGTMLIQCCVAIAVLACFSWGIRLPHQTLSVLSLALTSAFALLALIPMGIALVNVHAKLRHVPKEAFDSTVLPITALSILGLWFATGVPLLLLGVNASLRGTAFAVGQYHLLGLAICPIGVFAGLGLTSRKIRQMRDNFSRRALLIGAIAFASGAMLQLFEGFIQARHPSGQGKIAPFIGVTSTSFLLVAGSALAVALTVYAHSRNARHRPT